MDEYVVLERIDLTVSIESVYQYNSMLEWNQIGSFKRNNLFDQPCKANERELYEILETDAFNKSGIKIMYYPCTFNTSFDKIFGEDRNRFVERTFKVTGYTEQLQPETTNYTLMGMGFSTINKFYFSRIHFLEASKMMSSTPNVYPERAPLPGDIIRTMHNNVFWEVVNVEKTTERFLNSHHTFTVVVKAYTDFKMTLSNDITLINDLIKTVVPNTLSASEPFDDYLKINSVIDTKKQEIKYEPGLTEKPEDNPFGGW